MTNSKTITLIDGQNIIRRCYGAWYGANKPNNELMPNIPDGWPIPFVFMRSLCTTIAKLMPTHGVVVCMEGGTIQRRKFYEHYKAKRHKKAADRCSTDDISKSAYIEWERKQLDACVTVCKKILPVATLAFDGHEGDDIIAAAAQAYSGVGYGVTIVSNDSDMRQLMVLPGVSIYDPGKTNGIVEPIDINDIRDSDMARWKALIGDKSDEVPAVCSAKKAIEHLSAGTLDEALDTNTYTRKGFNYGLTWREAYERNIRLVTLLGDRRLFPLVPPQDIIKAACDSYVPFNPAHFIDLAYAMQCHDWFEFGTKTPNHLLSRQLSVWSQLAMHNELQKIAIM